ncbi:MAG TPA: hypothetical protein PKV10_12440, partial [Thermoanaerobaculia bacterium]|nr:hypothetical protein [Thermoanaerobaculia bacterium]
MNDVPEGANPPNSATPNFDRYVEYDYSLGMPVKARYVYCDRIDDDPNNPCSVETEQILAPLVVDRDYHPGGLPHHTYFNNGVDEITELDPWGMTRPYRMVVSAGSTDFWDSGYFRYDGAGNITNIGEQTAYIPGLDATSTSISWSESYSYDRLSRLT